MFSLCLSLSPPLSPLSLCVSVSLLSCSYRHMPNLSMAYITLFLRLFTVSLSSLGSSVYLQNWFCQSYWSIMHWHQWAYFHFNNTEIFFNIMWFCIDLCDRMKAAWRWSNSRLFQVTSAPSICQSHSRGLENERALWLEGISPKQCQITHFSCSSSSTIETCQNPASVIVSQGSFWIQQWTGASCLVTCYLYHVLEFCVRSQTAFLKNAR